MATEESGSGEFQRSLWVAISGEPLRLPRLDDDVEADAAIVGGGILGVSLALHAAEAGLSVVLVEAEEIGFGASGRNTGFVVPSFVGGIGPERVRELLGAAQGDRLSRFVGGSGRFLFGLIARLGLDCAAEPNGWLQPAHTAAKFDMLRQRVERWRAFGQPVRLVDRAETAHLTGASIYHGALLDETGGQINPLAYVRGLARAAVAAGAALHERSPVAAMARRGKGWRIETGSGSIGARTVILATNAMDMRLAPAVRRSLIPARPYQVATQPLGEEVRARILPRRQPLADLHNHTFAVRWSPDNRLVSGGLAVVPTAGSVDRMARHFLARLCRYLPGLPELGAAFAWRGTVATTPDFLPHLWEVEPGLLAPIGCNGRGVAVTTALGAALAGFLKTGEAAALPVPFGPPQPNPLNPVLRLGPSLWLAWNRLKDRREDFGG